LVAVIESSFIGVIPDRC